MNATAPITQDLLTIPRRDASDGLPDIIGMTREQLRAALIGAGTPERMAAMRTSQIWQWVYHKGLTDFDGMTNLARPVR